MIELKRIYLPSVSSTNDYAKENAEALNTDCVIVTYDQRAGRGKMDAKWHMTPNKDLAMTFILNCPARETHEGLTLRVGACVLNMLSQYGIQANIKEPNDVMVHGKKLAGILCESSFEGERFKYTVIGIGLNVRSGTEDFPDRLKATSTSMAEVSHKDYDLGDVEHRLTEIIRKDIYESESID